MQRRLVALLRSVDATGRPKDIRVTDQQADPALGLDVRWDASVSTGATARHLESARWNPDPLQAPAVPEPARESVIVGLVLTGYLDTEIRSRVAGGIAADRYRWSFGPGIDRTEPLRTAPAGVRAVIDDLTDISPCRLSLSWIDGDRRHHLAPGRASLAAHIGRRDATASRRDLTVAASGLGSLLRRLGRIDSSAVEELSTPSGTRRLAHWLRTGDGPWAAGVMHDRLISMLGSTRVDEIISWIDEMPSEHLVHGRAGLAATVVSETAAPAALLTGDEIACGPADFDMAWVLGEFLVTEHMVRYAPDDIAAARQRELITACRDAFLIGYGPARDLVSAGRTTTLRVLLELHDFAAYQDRQLDELAVQAAELVDYAR